MKSKFWFSWLKQSYEYLKDVDVDSKTSFIITLSVPWEIERLQQVNKYLKYIILSEYLTSLDTRLIDEGIPQSLRHVSYRWGNTSLS